MAVYSLEQWNARLATSGKRINPLVAKTMMKAGYNIRDDWRTRATAANPVHATDYPRAIVMRRVIVDDEGVISVKVEPAGFGGGLLGNILEAGVGGNAPQKNDEKSLNAELPNLIRWLNKIVAEDLS